MSTIWFTADTHFGHIRIPAYTYRRFCLNTEELRLLDSGAPTRGPDGWTPSRDSIAKMDNHLIEQINSHVGYNDILWHLGDFSFAPRDKTLERARMYRDQIHCKTINFTWGNHDRSEIAAIFNSCYERYTLKWQRREAVLSHYAQAVWNKSHRGAWHLYGHSHSTAEWWLDKYMKGRRSLDVGVDNIYKVIGEYRPISFDELDEMFEKRLGHSIDHHSQPDGPREE